MGNWLSTSITIGGTLREADVEEFLKQVNHEDLHWDWADNGKVTEYDLREAAKGKPEPLYLCGEANYGLYEVLERWLTNHDMPWIRQNSSDGGDVNSGCQVWTPEDGEYWIPVDNQGEEMFPAAKVKEAVTALREGRIHDALDMLTKVKVTPALPPFKIEP